MHCNILPQRFCFALTLTVILFMKGSLTVSTSLRELLSLQESAEKLPGKQVPNQVEGSSAVLIIGGASRCPSETTTIVTSILKVFPVCWEASFKAQGYLAGPG